MAFKLKGLLIHVINDCIIYGIPVVVSPCHSVFCTQDYHICSVQIFRGVVGRDANLLVGVCYRCDRRHVLACTVVANTANLNCYQLLSVLIFLLIN